MTNEENSAPEEDWMLEDFLHNDFDFTVSHPIDCLRILNTVKGVVIRNIWPTHEYQEEWDRVKAFLRDSDLPVYNPLIFRGDIEGKDYLVWLYDQGFPVIPSVDSVKDLEKLPATKYYWIKPKRSCDGVGSEKLTRNALLEKNPKGYIIQPFVEFEYEPSFFFIDNHFHHAMREKHRLFSEEVALYNPTPTDLDFAIPFVRWVNLPFGIQRIDAVRTTDGRLLLTEIENLCPYLYLSEVDAETRQQFLRAIRMSMLDLFSKVTVRLEPAQQS